MSAATSTASAADINLVEGPTTVIQGKITGPIGSGIRSKTCSFVAQVKIGKYNPPIIAYVDCRR